MRFFEHQRAARKQSQRLTWLFALIIIAQVLLVNAVLALPYLVIVWMTDMPLAHIGQLLPRYFFEVNTGMTLFYIFGGWWIEASRLSDGGQALAERIGAEPAQRLENNRGVASSDMRQIQFCNIVQEMALAARMRPPHAYVLPREESINAFAAGWGQRDSVICVTEGALETLNREQLTSLVAHELSHIYEGDTRLNMRLAGMVLGLELIYNLGTSITENEELPHFVLLGYLLRGVGWVGWMSARVMKAAISREREFLADARAVQYTRSKNGLGGTLRKVLWQQEEGMRFSVAHPAVQHMLLVGEWTENHPRLQTHPPVADRIARIYGRPMQALPAVDEGQEPWQNPFAHSIPPPNEEHYRGSSS